MQYICIHMAVNIQYISMYIIHILNINSHIYIYIWLLMFNICMIYIHGNRFIVAAGGIIHTYIHIYLFIQLCLVTQSLYIRQIYYYQQMQALIS